MTLTVRVAGSGYEYEWRDANGRVVLTGWAHGRRANAERDARQALTEHQQPATASTEGSK